MLELVVLGQWTFIFAVIDYMWTVYFFIIVKLVICELGIFIYADIDNIWAINFSYDGTGQYLSSKFLCMLELTIWAVDFNCAGIGNSGAMKF